MVNMAVMENCLRMNILCASEITRLDKDEEYACENYTQSNEYTKVVHPISYKRLSGIGDNLKQ